MNIQQIVVIDYPDGDDLEKMIYSGAIVKHWDMSDIFNERAMQRLFSNMNQHVPVKRRSLKQLLEDPDPSYEGKDGRRYRLDRGSWSSSRGSWRTTRLPDLNCPS